MIRSSIPGVLCGLVALVAPRPANDEAPAVRAALIYDWKSKKWHWAPTPEQA